MKIGLVGFAGSGKTTVFNALTGHDAPTGYGGEFRLAAVRVPDERVDRLSEIFQPRKTTYAEITFCDVPGDHGGERHGLSRKALHQIREQEALCLVLRGFDNPALEGDPDPVADLESFAAESILADLEIVERRLDRMARQKTDPRERACFEALQQGLESEVPIRAMEDPAVDPRLLEGYAFLTDKPLLVVLNRGEEDAAEGLPDAVRDRLGELGADGLSLCAEVESEIARLDPEDQADFLEDLGMDAPALERFVRTAYGLVDLISYFTVGEDEVRAWTIERGTRARAAAGRIHSDLERGFIRAEVIPYEVFMEYGSEAKVKEAGKSLIAGADYTVKDGDLLHVRFNV